MTAALFRVFFLVALFSFTWTSATFAAEEKQAVASPGVGGAFSLVDGEGKSVNEKSWPGKYKLVFFGFTHCPEICPVTLDKVTAALGKLGDDAGKIQPLFITTDPARDTPEVVKAFTANFHKSITGLTGTAEQVKSAENAYKVYAVKREGGSKDDYQVDHSSYIYFMSPDDKMLAIMGSSASADDIVSKVKAVLN